MEKSDWIKTQDLLELGFNEVEPSFWKHSVVNLTIMKSPSIPSFYSCTQTDKSVRTIDDLKKLIVSKQSVNEHPDE